MLCAAASFKWNEILISFLRLFADNVTVLQNVCTFIINFCFKHFLRVEVDYLVDTYSTLSFDKVLGIGQHSIPAFYFVVCVFRIVV